MPDTPADDITLPTYIYGREAGANEKLWTEQSIRAAILADRASHVPSETVQLAPSRAGRVYLAGPMTGHAEFNFPAFNEAAAMLRASGVAVVNPAEHGIVEGATWADYLRFDIAKIATCESIALLPGWSKSQGALLEVHIAQALGMPLRYLDGAEHPTTSQTVPAAQAAPAPEVAALHALLQNETPDALRFRFLCEDHADPVIRDRVRSLLGRMAVMSLSAVRADIDAMPSWSSTGAATQSQGAQHGK